MAKTYELSESEMRLCSKALLATAQRAEPAEVGLAKRLLKKLNGPEKIPDRVKITKTSGMAVEVQVVSHIGGIEVVAHREEVPFWAEGSAIEISELSLVVMEPD